jgi:hypothetical protein
MGHVTRVHPPLAAAPTPNDEHADDQRIAAERIGLAAILRYDPISMIEDPLIAAAFGSSRLGAESLNASILRPVPAVQKAIAARLINQKLTVVIDGVIALAGNYIRIFGRRLRRYLPCHHQEAKLMACFPS